jgi:hypothetical protein
MIAVRLPRSVEVLGQDWFGGCLRLMSVWFERPSNLRRLGSAT